MLMDSGRTYSENEINRLIAMSDDQIIETLSYWLDHDAEREERVRRGLELSSEYTQEKYAERFVREASVFLEDMRHGRV